MWVARFGFGDLPKVSFGIDLLLAYKLINSTQSYLSSIILAPKYLTVGQFSHSDSKSKLPVKKGDKFYIDINHAVSILWKWWVAVV